MEGPGECKKAIFFSSIEEHRKSFIFGLSISSSTEELATQQTDTNRPSKTAEKSAWPAAQRAT